MSTDAHTHTSALLASSRAEESHTPPRRIDDGGGCCCCCCCLLLCCDVLSVQVAPPSRRLMCCCCRISDVSRYQARARAANVWPRRQSCCVCDECRSVGRTAGGVELASVQRATQDHAFPVARPWCHVRSETGGWSVGDGRWMPL